MMRKRYYIPLIISFLVTCFVAIVFGLNNHAGDYCVSSITLDPDNCPIDYPLLVNTLIVPVFFWFTAISYMPVILWKLICKLWHFRSGKK